MSVEILCHYVFNISYSTAASQTRAVYHAILAQPDPLCKVNNSDAPNGQLTSSVATGLAMRTVQISPVRRRINNYHEFQSNDPSA